MSVLSLCYLYVFYKERLSDISLLLKGKACESAFGELQLKVLNIDINMDSAHGDERNLAHSASGRNVHKVADDQQIIKLREEHGREIQKLNYESKIELMEAQMKNVSLEKDNQTLGHRLEMLKLKNSHEAETKQVAADKDLQIKLTEMEKQLAIKDKEIAAKKMELMTKDQEMLEKK
uniref:Uncharacterized protein n=1 Tax=Clytia hemisphaerica TaxID=252671 RepID=A0A7M5XAT6_9CNID